MNWELAQKLKTDSQPFVVITLISIRGHAPQDPGAKALVTSQGLLWGTVGGGKVEARSIEESKRLLREKTAAPWLVTWNLQRDIGMTCGGEVTLLFEVHRSPQWRVVIFGAGHIVQALVRVLEPLECELICVDSRGEWLSKLPQSERTKKYLLEDPKQFVAECRESDFFLSITQGHAADLPILTEIFRKFPGSPYIGVIGSESKAIRLKSDLKASGISSEVLEKLHCPMGLSIGTNHPQEIAISISAELLSARDRISSFGSSASVSTKA